MQRARIADVAGYLPERIETNEELARENPDWDMARIAGKTGIAARHIAAPDETAADLGFQAARRLLDRETVPWDEIDYLMVSSQTPDHLLPADACLLQHRLGLRTGIGAFDFRLGCSGFVCGLQLAKSLVVSQAARHVLLITTDTYSKLIHPRDRTVRALFGDGAAATLIGPADDATGYLGQFLAGTDGSGGTSLIVPGGGARIPRSAATGAEYSDAQGAVRSQDHLFMDGQAIFSFALNTVPKAITALLGKSGRLPQDVDWWIYHQANRFMLENLAMCSRIPPEKVAYYLENTGNTVSASIPLAIEHYVRSGRIHLGQRLVLVGFGVGLSWNLCEMVWG
jgi:3-oxoacyl-[acyl-carrier-protein] synthase III